jgi:hypothetical protein
MSLCVVGARDAAGKQFDARMYALASGQPTNRVLRPPSTTISAAVTYLASSEAR